LKVAEAAQWNFQNQSSNISTSIPIPLRQTVFLRAGNEWRMDIPLDFGASVFTDIQLSLRDNAGTKGDAQGTWPVIRWSNAVTGIVTLSVTVVKTGSFAISLRLTDNVGNVSMYEATWLTTEDRRMAKELKLAPLNSFLINGSKSAFRAKAPFVFMPEPFPAREETVRPVSPEKSIANDLSSPAVRPALLPDPKRPVLSLETENVTGLLCAPTGHDTGVVCNVAPTAAAAALMATGASPLKIRPASASTASPKQGERRFLPLVGSVATPDKDVFDWITTLPCTGISAWDTTHLCPNDTGMICLLTGPLCDWIESVPSNLIDVVKMLLEDASTVNDIETSEVVLDMLEKLNSDAALKYLTDLDTPILVAIMLLDPADNPTSAEEMDKLRDIREKLLEKYHTHLPTADKQNSNQPINTQGHCSYFDTNIIGHQHPQFPYEDLPGLGKKADTVKNKTSAPNLNSQGTQHNKDNPYLSNLSYYTVYNDLGSVLGGTEIAYNANDRSLYTIIGQPTSTVDSDSNDTGDSAGDSGTFTVCSANDSASATDGGDSRTYYPCGMVGGGDLP
jgi:hypothetical protein